MKLREETYPPQACRSDLYRRTFVDVPLHTPKCFPFKPTR
jgi:hypothetical protein